MKLQNLKGFKNDLIQTMTQIKKKTTAKTPNPWVDLVDEEGLSPLYLAC